MPNEAIQRIGQESGLLLIFALGGCTKLMMVTMDLRKYIFIVLAFGYLSGCATGSVRMIGDVATYKSGGCEVKVYQTKNQAIESGMTKEVCVVEGSSAFSFDHSIEGAIKNNIDKVCQCGVTKAYVQSAHTESRMGIKGVSYVDLVGFK